MAADDRHEAITPVTELAVIRRRLCQRRNTGAALRHEELAGCRFRKQHHYGIQNARVAAAYDAEPAADRPALIDEPARGGEGRTVGVDLHQVAQEQQHRRANLTLSCIEKWERVGSNRLVR